MAVIAKLYTDFRSAERYSTLLDGTLRTSNWEPVDVRLEELSSTGCRLSSAISVEVNELITIGVLGVGMRPARVSRIAGEHLGCTFLVPLAPTELRDALARPEVSIPSLQDSYIAVFEEVVSEPSLLVAVPFELTRPAMIGLITLATWALLFAVGWLVLL